MKRAATQARPSARSGAATKDAAEVKRWTLERQADFLAHLAMTCNVRASARAVGMSEQGVHRLRLRSPEFRDAWETALAEGYVRLEMMLLDRALNGVEKTVVGKNGEPAGSVTEHSDRLALALMNAPRRATPRPRAAEAQRDRKEVRRLVEAKLSEMNKRMGGEG
jgi:hypothetical protein